MQYLISTKSHAETLHDQLALLWTHYCLHSTAVPPGLPGRLLTMTVPALPALPTHKSAEGLSPGSSLRCMSCRVGWSPSKGWVSSSSSCVRLRGLCAVAACSVMVDGPRPADDADGLQQKCCIRCGGGGREPRQRQVRAAVGRLEHGTAAKPCQISSATGHFDEGLAEERLQVAVRLPRTRKLGSGRPITVCK